MVFSRLQRGFLFFFVLIPLCALEAQPGPPPGGSGRRAFRGPPPIDARTLLRVESVRRELALSAEQVSRIDVLLREQGRGPQASGAPAKAQTDPRATERRLVAALEVAQYQRLREILLQQRRAEALVDLRVVDALRLDEGQLEKIREVLSWGREQARSLFPGRGPGPGGGGRAGSRGRPTGDALEVSASGGRGSRDGRPDFRGMRARHERLAGEVEIKALAILTSEQKREFETLKGEPFRLDRRALRRGRRRGRRGRGFGASGRFAREQDVPRRAPEELDFQDGVATIPDRATFERLSYQGPEVLIDTHLDGVQFVKFQIEDPQSDAPQLYFINTKTHRAHMMFSTAVGLSRRHESMRGVLAFRPLLKAPDGQPGMYTYEFEPNDSYPFSSVELAYGLLVEKMPLLKDRLSYLPMPGAMERYRKEKELYDSSVVPVVLEEDLLGEIAYLPLHEGAAYGRLREMAPGERPGPRDIVLYRTLPNELSRVAGIITAARQTPLSHVNLRAIQDDVPNAFVASALEHEEIASLVGKDVYYRVGADGFEIRAASRIELERHFAALRPAEPLIPRRDLSARTILPLAEVSFEASKSVGVKAANLAVLLTLGLGESVVPDGYVVPFSFYDEFMKHNGFYARVDALLADPAFRAQRDRQEAELARLRSMIRGGDLPDWMFEALGELQKAFPDDTLLRCRSSTNNEDLPGFSGAGLYDSCTHHPDEGHLAKSIKQVFASLWNFRAVEEREFYRVDHEKTAMAVLVHPAFRGERANGVAVSDDVLYQTQGNHYINVQVGEDLVTNPNAESIPEEVLVDWWDGRDHKVMRRSNRTESGTRILDAGQLERLRCCLGKIHNRFSSLYGHSPEDEGFAMEIEFKVANDGTFVVKQARPWVD